LRRTPCSPLLPYTTLFRSDDVLAFFERILGLQHGFAVFPDSTRARDENKDWVALARQGGEVTGLLRYRTKGLGHELTADAFLTLDRKSTRLNSSHVKISYA